MTTRATTRRKQRRPPRWAQIHPEAVHSTKNPAPSWLGSGWGIRQSDGREPTPRQRNSLSNIRAALTCARCCVGSDHLAAAVGFIRDELGAFLAEDGAGAAFLKQIRDEVHPAAERWEQALAAGDAPAASAAACIVARFAESIFASAALPTLIRGLKSTVAKNRGAQANKRAAEARNAEWLRTGEKLIQKHRGTENQITDVTKLCCLIANDKQTKPNPDTKKPPAWRPIYDAIGKDLQQKIVAYL